MKARFRIVGNWSRTISGISLVALGAVLLANTVGLIPWKAWVALKTYWPVLIIAAGAELLFLRRFTPALWLGAAALIVVLAFSF